MNKLSRRTSILALSAALLSLALAVPALAVHFEKESLQSYEGQLHHGEVHALGFHPGSPTGTLHISLNDGEHKTVSYPAADQNKLVAQAQAGGARVKVAAAVTKATAVKHKLRYIAAGVLIAVIVVVLIVLLIGRRRAVAGEGPKPSEESAG